VLVVLVCLRKIPDRSLRAVVTASTQDRSARMVVCVFICPLPDISHHIHYAEGARSVWMRIDIARRRHYPAAVCKRSRCILRIGRLTNRPRDARYLRRPRRLFRDTRCRRRQGAC